jgi:hypothetical protein
MVLDLAETRLAQTYSVTLLTSVYRTVAIVVIVCNSTVVVLSVTTVVSILVDVAVTVIVGSVVLIIDQLSTIRKLSILYGYVVE